jgi:hypothetical protein
MATSDETCAEMRREIVNVAEWAKAEARKATVPAVARAYREAAATVLAILDNVALKERRCRVVRYDGTVCGGEIGPELAGGLACYRCVSDWPEERWRVPEDKREPPRAASPSSDTEAGPCSHRYDVLARDPEDRCLICGAAPSSDTEGR